MPSPNRIILASAGSGKTTKIVTDSAQASPQRCALVTYTNNSSAEFLEKARDQFGMLPSNVTIGTWYSFLLHHFVRPYQTSLYRPRIRDVAMTNGLSVPYIPAANVQRHYFLKPGCIYLDKVAKFACSIIDATDGEPIRRFEKIFDQLFIDEIQDLRAYDLVLIEHLLESNVELTMVGDVRQGTYGTNPQRKYRQFSGPRIIGKFEEWSQSDHTTIEPQAISYRCIQGICEFADRLYPDLPAATSLNAEATEHDGVFAVREKDIKEYRARYNPQTLQLKRTRREVPGCPINYGAAKGMTFERVLLYAHKGFLDMIKSDDVSKLGPSDETKAKIYVGITRARQSVGIVVPDRFTPASIPVFEP